MTYHTMAAGGFPSPAHASLVMHMKCAHIHGTSLPTSLAPQRQEESVPATAHRRTQRQNANSGHLPIQCFVHLTGSKYTNAEHDKPLRTALHLSHLVRQRRCMNAFENSKVHCSQPCKSEELYSTDTTEIVTCKCNAWRRHWVTNETLNCQRP